MNTATARPPRSLRRRLSSGIAALTVAAVSVIGLTAPAQAADGDPATHTGVSDAAVTFTVPTEVTEGEDITISGTGWTNTAGTAGSVIGVKLDEGGVSTTREVTNPANGQVQGNKTIWAIAQADADGDWTATFPYPTSENSNATWAAGETHNVRLLTGSLLTGDKIRTEAASFTVVAESTDVAPTVTTQPVAVSVAEGEDATFTAAADGTPTPTVQWQSSTDGSTWTDVDGATDTTLTVSGATTDQSGTQYQAVFTNEAGSATTDAATLTVTAATAAAAFVQDLPATAVGTLSEIGSASRIGTASDVTGTAIAEGVPDDATITWYRKLGSAAETAAFTAVVPSTTGSGYVVDTSSEDGQLTSTITFTGSVNTYSNTYYKTLSGLKWYVVISWTDDSGVAQSLTSTTTVWTALLKAPTIKTQPADTTVNEGATATFTVADTDGFGATYQWQSSADGETWADVDGATTTTLAVTGTTVAQSGTQYRAVVTNTGGTVTSDAATLTVNSLSVAPTVLTSPGDASATVLTSGVNFTATADLMATAAQWQVRAPGGEWTDIAGATSLTTGTGQVSSTYRLYITGTDGTATPPADGTQYRAAFSNSVGTTYTDAATLTMLDSSAAVTIAEDAVVRGGTVHVSATGLPANQSVTVFYYQTNAQLIAASAGVTTDANGALTDVPVQLSLARYGDGGYPYDYVGGDGLLPLDDLRLTLTVGGYDFATDTVTVVADPDAVAPVITVQPVQKTFATGQPLTYSVTIADNPGPVKTMWTWKQVASTPNEANNAGNSGTMTQDGNTYTLTVPANTAAAGNAYRFWAWTPAGVVTSDFVTVHYAAAEAPAVTSQPTGQLAAPGDSATFTAAASGVTTPDVQWQSSVDGTTWADVAGATQTTLTLSDVALADSGTQYRAVFTNQAGTAASNAATLTVTAAATAPVVTTQPQSTSVAKGDTATFAAAASGAPAPTVQWWSKTATGDWAVVTGATGTTLTVLDTTIAQDGTQYKAVFTNSVGVAETGAATLTVTASATKTYTGASDPAVTFTVPTEVVAGEDVTVSGTGWKVIDGSRGSIVAIKLDDGGVSTTGTVTNPETGAVQGNKTIWAIAVADAAGNWTATFPFPTAENSNATWAAGETHDVRLLTGSLVTGDKIRTEAASFTVTDGPTKTYTGTSDAAVTFTVPTEVTEGEDITISGTGWKNTAGTAGSVIGVKLDDGGVSTTREVTNPANGQVQGNKTIYAIAQADADGDWTATFPFPTSENSNATWAAGETHNVRLLTGSLLTGDKIRTEAASFTVVAAPVSAPPTITAQPASVTVTESEDAVFTAAATGTPKPTVRWQSSADGSTWTDVPGATEATLTVPATTASQSGMQYRAVFTNDGGTATSAVATLTVSTQRIAPVVTTQPASVSVAKGDTATFTAAASGTPAPTVQWWSKTGSGSWVAISGATGRTLTVANTTVAQDGTRYRAVFTNSAGTATTKAATLTVTADVTKTYTGSSDPSVTFTVPAEVAVGDDITISGTGWKTAAGTVGSVIGIKLDEGGVTTTREVVNPADGTVQANKTIWAVAQADADGNWTATFPFPTAENSNATWAPGERHNVRLLTGSLLTGDKIRTEAAEFSIVPKGVSCEAGQLLVSDTAGGQTAIACVQQDVSTDAGSTITVTGSGWLTADGTAGATVVLKLASRATPSSADFQFVHTGAAGDAILTHPTNGTADPTMWALVKADADGSFTATFRVPTAANVPVNVGSAGALAAGSKLVVHFQTGLLSTDTVHSFDSPSLVVDGQEYSGDVDGSVVECIATGPAEAHIESADGSAFDPTTGPIVAYGGTIRLVGTGWCNNDPAKGGSVVAIKIDEGAYSRLPSEIVNANAQVWQLVDVNSADGSFDVEITLPAEGDGPGGATPSFAMGTHTLRLLTGSLKAGDPIRTFQTGPFTVGQYQPNGVPDPVDAATLTDAAAHGVTVAMTDTSLVVTVPGAQEGDWIFVTPFATDGSPRFPWETWAQADAAGRVTLPLAGVTLPTGTIKVAAQSGNAGEVGTLLGWGWLTVASPDPGPIIDVPDTDAGDGAGDGTQSRPVFDVVGGGSTAQAPSAVPAPPFPTGDGLTAANAGGVTGVQDGTVVTLTLPGADPGDWVYVYAYSTPVAVGWIQVDANRQVRVDIAALPAGAHKLAVLDADGALIGWAGVTRAASATAKDAGSDAAKAADGAAPIDSTSSSGGLSAADWWLIGGGAAIVLAGLAVALIVGARRRADTEGAQR